MFKIDECNSIEHEFHETPNMYQILVLDHQMTNNLG